VRENLTVASISGKNTLTFEGTGISDSYGLTVTAVKIEEVKEE
jgi:hypothetical protein